LSRSRDTSMGFVVATLALGLAACGGSEAPAPAPAPEPVAEPAPVEPAPVAAAPRVFFVEPADGAKVTSPVKVVMGVEGLTIHKAGEVIEGTGHHHIVVDGDFVPSGTVVPSDEKHIHFGAGQTEAEVPLAPGPHTLRLQFADGMHSSYGEGLSTVIAIEVVAAP